MSVELELLPMRLGLESGFSHEVVRAGYACEEWWSAIRALNTKSLPEDGIYCYLARSADSETCYGKRNKDPYGESLEYVTAEELLPVAEKYFLDSAVGFLKGLDPLNPVVLYWH